MFRRPMMYITSVFAVTILLSYYYGVYFALLIIAAAVLFLFSSAYFTNSQCISFVLALTMISGVLCFVFSYSDKHCFDDRINQEVNASFVVCDVDTVKTADFRGNESEYLCVTAKLKILEKEETGKNEKVIIKYYGDEQTGSIIPGCHIKVCGTVELPSGKRNPGCFDYALHLKSLGINHVITADHIEMEISTDNSLGIESLWERLCGRLFLFKRDFISAVEKGAGKETAGILRGVLFGDTESIDDEVLDEFRKNGTAHVMAVSGLHVGIIYGMLCLLWRWKKGEVFLALNIIFFLLYMILASFSPSVVRAVIMVWIHILADITNRRYDMASAAFFTALIMLINEPMYIFNTGFQMSFLAVLTLSLMVPFIKRVYSGMFLVSLAVQLGLTPYIIYVFNYFSLAAVLVNVPIIALISVIVPLGMFCMVMMFSVEPLGVLISKVLGGLCMMLEKLNTLTCVEEITVFDVRSPDLWVIALYYLVMLVFLSEDGRLMIMRKKIELVKQMICIVMAATFLFSLAAGNHYKNSDVVFVDVGQGDCIHIRVEKNIFGSKYNYLSDGGGSISYDVGKETLKPYLLKNGVKKIDGAFVTHLHTDHYKGITELCREGMIKRLYVFEGYKAKESEILADTGLSKERIIYLHAGQRVNLGNDAYADIIWPEPSSYSTYEKMTADEEDENDLCLIIKVTVKGSSVLITGDVDSACLDDLADKYGNALDIDILKAAHHGSKYSDSESFVQAADPGYVVFQVGKNNFGHPNEGVIENFRQKGIMIYRNDLDGAVAFDFSKKGMIRAQTVKGE